MRGAGRTVGGCLARGYQGVSTPCWIWQHGRDICPRDAPPPTQLPRTDSVGPAHATPPTTTTSVTAPHPTFRAQVKKGRNYFSSTSDDRVHLIITKHLKSECKYPFCKLRRRTMKLLRIYGSISLFDKMSIISVMVCNYRLTDATSLLENTVAFFLVSSFMRTFDRASVLSRPLSD